MARFPFLPDFEKLPHTLPVFPLPGALLMPGSELPLNVFEPRYLNMVEDALGTHRLIGMIQPNQSPQASDDELSQSGCAGRITQYRETKDRRIEIILTGVCRFDAGEELLTTRGYRMIRALWSRYAADCEDNVNTTLENGKQLLMSIRHYFQAQELEINWKRLEQLSHRQLLNSLTCVLPLAPVEKQALLETVDDTERAKLFIGLLDSDFSEKASVTRH